MKASFHGTNQYWAMSCTIASVHLFNYVFTRSKCTSIQLRLHKEQAYIYSTTSSQGTSVHLFNYVFTRSKRTSIQLRLHNEQTNVHLFNYAGSMSGVSSNPIKGSCSLHWVKYRKLITQYWLVPWKQFGRDLNVQNWLVQNGTYVDWT